jgi:hypothetical protein
MPLEKENVNELQRCWRNEFGTPPTCVTVARLYKFGVDVTKQNLDKEHSEELAVQPRMEMSRQCYRSS